MTNLTFPLRGLASEGAQAIVDRALGALAGVLSARAGSDQLLHIEFDDALISQLEIHDALARAGIVHVADATQRTAEGAGSGGSMRRTPECGARDHG